MTMPKPVATKPAPGVSPTLDQLDAAAVSAKWRSDVPLEGEWHRVRKVNQNGVYGWVLERLTVVGEGNVERAEMAAERLHDPDQRDIILGKLMREVELGA